MGEVTLTERGSPTQITSTPPSFKKNEDRENGIPSAHGLRCFEWDVLLTQMIDYAKLSTEIIQEEFP